METPLDSLNAKSFAEQLHSTFYAQLGGAKIALKLSAVEEHNLPRVESFSLIFQGPPSPRLPQKIYEMEHEKLGNFSLFLTAVAGDKEGISYEAAFNRIKQ
jgi:hypothetical protein